MLDNTGEYGVLVQVQRKEKGLAVAVGPVVVGEDPIKEDIKISDVDVLKDLMYGLSTVIRRMEASNPESRGKLMTHVMNTLGELYAEPFVEPLTNEEFERSFRGSDEPREEENPGDELDGGISQNQDW